MFVDNGATVSIGGNSGNGATDKLFAQNNIVGNTNIYTVCIVLHSFSDWLAAHADGALVGNHVIASNTDDARSPRLLDYDSGNITFFVASKDGSGRTGKA